jgi:chromosome segregation ATPase
MKTSSILGASINPFKLQLTQGNLIQNQQTIPNEIPIDQTNTYLQSLTEQYRKEITFLKQYISRINTEIRKNLNIQIPSLEEGLTLAIKDDSPINQANLTEWLNSLINVDYINPLFTLYDTHIMNLENEIQHKQSLLGKYDRYVSDLVNENKMLRQQLEIRDSEFKNFLEIKTANEDGESNIVIDREYVLKLEERNNLLSKENELLAVGYHALQKEMFELKQNVNQTFQSNNDKALAYDQLYVMYEDAQNNLNTLTSKLKTGEGKIYELGDEKNKIEVENQNLKMQIEELQNENKNLKQMILQLQGNNYDNQEER